MVLDLKASDTLVTPFNYRKEQVVVFSKDLLENTVKNEDQPL